MDWNVFFSTISQTSGAIVGIFSAFLITKIVANQSDFSQEQNEAIEFILKSESLCDEAKSRYFKWYNERIRASEIDDITENFYEKGELLTSEEYFQKYNFSSFDSKKEIKRELEDKIYEFEIEREKEKSELEKYGNSPLGFTYAIPKKKYMRSLANFSINTTPERESIDALMVRTIHQIKTNKTHLNKLNIGQNSSNLITFSIIAVLLLFFSGVIYPLSFLPLEIGVELKLSLSGFWDILFSLKGAMLSLISVIFTSLMLAFLIVNMKLCHSIDHIEKLKKYSELKNYSIYYENYIENTGSNGQEFI